jgi:hypothetical protein
LQRFASKVELESWDRRHLRWLPGPRAAELVTSGQAVIRNSNGKVKSIQLTGSPGAIIGPPTGGWGAPPFAVREHLDCGAITWRHHPRSTYERPE